MIVTTSSIVKHTGFRNRWISSKFFASKMDYVINGESAYNIDLMLIEAENLIKICSTKNKKQYDLSIKMLNIIIKYCKDMK